MATVPSAEPTPMCSPDELQGGGRGMGSVGKEGGWVLVRRGEREGSRGEGGGRGWKGMGVSKERGEGREEGGNIVGVSKE